MAGSGNPKTVNGINIDQLFATIEQIKGNAEIAKFKFRAKNQWVGGTHSQATVKDFYGALQEDDARDAVVFHLDEPPSSWVPTLGPIPWNTSWSPCPAA